MSLFIYRFFLSFEPTSTMALIAGINSCPNAVRVYSTEGGDVAKTWRVITPFPVSSRSRALRTLAEIRGMSCRNSPKRRGPALKYQMTLGVQALPKRDIHWVSGHASGGGGALFFRNRNAIGMFPPVTQ